MNPDRRWMALRAVVWILIIIWAVSIIRDQDGGDSVGAAMTEVLASAPAEQPWETVARPPAANTPAPSGELADALSVFAAAWTKDCPQPTAALRLTFGPPGLVAVESRGKAPLCVAERLWGATWPAHSTPMEIEFETPAAMPNPTP